MLYLHSDGHWYEIRGHHFRRVDKETGDTKLSAIWMVLLSIALWAPPASLGYLIWTWVRAGAFTQ